jgi:uncharacterized membrane protein
MFGLGGWLTMLGCIALVVGLVLVAAWALGKTGTKAEVAVPPTRQGTDAIEVLRLRFARGEMTVEEYTAARQVLEAER